MTREEEIQSAINMYAPSVWSIGHEETIPFTHDESIISSIAFTKGAQWADNNPKSPWINVNDSLPNDETKLYIIYCEAYNKNGNDIENKHYEIYLANFDKETSSWVNVESYNNYFFNVLYWMPISEPPKE